MIDELNTSLNQIIIQTGTNLNILACIFIVIWSVFIVNKLLKNRLLYFGIYPRHFFGLAGIFFAPLLHANFNHLFFNTIPLLILGNFVLMDGHSWFFTVTLVITVLSGLLIWCFGKPGIHIGASALITGYWGLLVVDSYQTGTFTAIILAIVCVYYFAGIFYGIFPGKKGVSWEGHLFGLVAGLFVSYSETTLRQLIWPAFLSLNG